MKDQRLKIKDANQRLKIFFKSIYFLFLICIFAFSFLIFDLPKASAQGVSLRLSPSVLRIKAEAPAEINVPLSIENLEEQSVELKTEFRLFKANDKEDGQVEYLLPKDNNSPIFSKIALLDGENNLSRLNLGPGQKKELKLRILVGEGESTGDYYFSVIFTRVQDSFQPASDKEEQHSISKINAGIGMNVLLSIQEPKQKDSEAKEPTAIIEEFSAPGFVETGPVPFTLNLHNKGSHFITPKGIIEITNMFGQLVGKVGIPPTNILAGSSRYISQTPLTPKPYPLSPEVFWNENFLLGFYTAKLHIETSPDDPVLSRTIHFAALPLKQILITILAIAIFLLIRKRVKAKMSSR
ncbi:MAG TPA: hypothetical protein VNA13_01870 [Xanthomonadales bacterium]|nr:hypothetical protein [Xanthomonadales bacterium]